MLWIWLHPAASHAPPRRARLLFASARPRLLSDNGPSYIAGDLEAQVEAFVTHYNRQRYQESLRNLTRPTSTSAAARPSCSSVNV